MKNNLIEKLSSELLYLTKARKMLKVSFLGIVSCDIGNTRTCKAGCLCNFTLRPMWSTFCVIIHIYTLLVSVQCSPYTCHSHMVIFHWLAWFLSPSWNQNSFSDEQSKEIIICIFVCLSVCSIICAYYGWKWVA